MAEPPLPLILLLPDIYQRRPPPLQPRALSDSSGSMSAVPHAFKGDFDPEFIDQVKTQGWSLFPVCMVFIILRMYAILRLGGGRDGDATTTATNTATTASCFRPTDCCSRYRRQGGAIAGVLSSTSRADSTFIGRRHTEPRGRKGWA